MSRNVKKEEVYGTSRDEESAGEEERNKEDSAKEDEHKKLKSINVGTSASNLFIQRLLLLQF